MRREARHRRLRGHRRLRRAAVRAGRVRRTRGGRCWTSSRPSASRCRSTSRRGREGGFGRLVIGPGRASARNAEPPDGHQRLSREPVPQFATRKYELERARAFVNAYVRGLAPRQIIASGDIVAGQELTIDYKESCGKTGRHGRAHGAVPRGAPARGARRPAARRCVQRRGREVTSGGGEGRARGSPTSGRRGPAPRSSSARVTHNVAGREGCPRPGPDATPWA